MRCSSFILDVIFTRQHADFILTDNTPTFLCGLWHLAPRPKKSVKESKKKKKKKGAGSEQYDSTGGQLRRGSPESSRERDDDSGSGRKNLWDPSDQSDGR